MDEQPIITEADMDEGLMREFYDEVAATIPAEKVKQNLALAATAKALQAEGSVRTEQGLGQKVASIPARVYFRWHQEFPGCWQDKGFVDAFLRDNPQCCAPGYKPTPDPTRHGKTFLNGKPV